MYKTISLILATLVALSGCITLPEGALEGAEAESTSTTPLPPTTQGNMSAQESSEDSVGACLDRGISIPQILMRCATRVTTVEGELDLESLPASLTSSFGDVAVVAGTEGEWSLELIVETTGATDDDARENLDDVRLVWTHKTPAGYALEAIVETTQDNLMNVDAQLTLTVPPSLLLGLTVGTSSGDISVQDVGLRGAGIASSSGDVGLAQIDADSLFVSTSSGDVELAKVNAGRLVVETSSGDATLDDVSVDSFTGSSSSGDVALFLHAKIVLIGTSSGDVMGTLVPTGAAQFTLGTTSGDISIGLPTGTTYGYRIGATTSSGDVEIELADGDVDCDEDNEKCSFETNGFTQRANRGILTLETSSGDIGVESSNGGVV